MTDKEIIEEQRRAIVALNTLIGGEDSTTTENLTLVGRLQDKIEELMLLIAVQKVIINELKEYKFMYESISK